MKCYVCKREINRSVRVFMDARDERERSQFRDLCQTCYETHMTELGYVAERGESGLTVWTYPDSTIKLHSPSRSERERKLSNVFDLLTDEDIAKLAIEYAQEETR